MKKAILLLFLLSSLFSYSQGALFGAKYSSVSHFNPALTGLTSSPRVSGLYQNQWLLYNSGLVIYDQALPTLNSGIGISYFGDSFKSGIIREDEVNIHYAYHLNLNKKSILSFGINGGINMQRINWTEFNLSVEPEEPYERTVKGELDFGMIYSRKRFLVGASVNNLPDLFTQNSALRFNLHGAYVQPLGDKMNIGFESSFQGRNGFNQIRSSIQANYKFIVLGLHHSSFSAVGFLAGVAFEQFRFSYSLDINTSPLSSYSKQTHEITFRWNFLSKKSDDSEKFNWLFF